MSKRSARSQVPSSTGAAECCLTTQGFPASTVHTAQVRLYSECAATRGVCVCVSCRRGTKFAGNGNQQGAFIVGTCAHSITLLLCTKVHAHTPQTWTVFSGVLYEFGRACVHSTQTKKKKASSRVHAHSRCTGHKQVSVRARPRT
jgi:hypothetical protein